MGKPNVAIYERMGFELVKSLVIQAEGDELKVNVSSFCADCRFGVLCGSRTASKLGYNVEANFRSMDYLHFGIPME
jgi:positive regulator of sigma E activity